MGELYAAYPAGKPRTFPAWYAVIFTMLYCYRSNCHMKAETCGQFVIEVPLQHCHTTALCNQQCPEERNFVCASDNKIYRSECEMKRDNCGYVFCHVMNEITGWNKM